MATVKGTNQTLIDAGGTGTMAGGLWRNKVKTCLDFYTLAGTETSGTVFKFFGALPAAANLIAVIIDVSAAQTALTLSVGDADSATRYASAITSLQTAGSYLISLDGRVVGTSTNDNQILYTTGGATATAGTLSTFLFYTEPAD